MNKGPGENTFCVETFCLVLITNGVRVSLEVKAATPEAVAKIVNAAVENLMVA